MAKLYAQSNEHGYIGSVTDVPLLVTLFGGEGIRVSEGAAKIIKERLAKMVEVHKDEISAIELMAKAEAK